MHVVDEHIEVFEEVFAKDALNVEIVQVINEHPLVRDGLPGNPQGQCE